MLSRSISLVQRLPLASRGFATKGSGSANRGGSYEDISSNNQTSNAPNYGTSNNSGGRFSGSPNQNFGGATNTTSPGSASKATSTSGTSQQPGTGTHAVNSKQSPQTANDSSIPNPKSNATPNQGSITDYFRSAFGTGFNKNTATAATNSMSTESSNPNRPSIPHNDGSPNARTPINDNVKVSIKDREPTGSTGPMQATTTSHLSSTASTSSHHADKPPVVTGSGSGPSQGGPQVNRTTIGGNYSTAIGNSGSSPAASSTAVSSTDADADLDADTVSDLERARSELPFNDVGTRYAYLLWSTYKEENALDKLDGDLKNLINRIEDSESLYRVFERDILVTESNREENLEEFLEETEDLEPKIEAFLRTLAETRRLSELPTIINCVEDVRDRIERNKKVAIVATAHPLTDQERETITKTIHDTFSIDGTVDIQEELKPELMGGYEIFYDGQYHLDNSQKTLTTELDDEISNAISGYINKQSAIPEPSQ